MRIGLGSRLAPVRGHVDANASIASLGDPVDLAGGDERPRRVGIEQGIEGGTPGLVAQVRARQIEQDDIGLREKDACDLEALELVGIEGRPRSFSRVSRPSGSRRISSKRPTAARAACT